MAAGAPRSPAAEPARGAPGAVSLVDGARLPLAFIALGLAALVLGAAWLAWRADALLFPHVQPTLVALAHVWLPGFLLSVCLGAVYQLMPVVLGAPLRLPLRIAWLHFGLHALGTGVLVAGFAIGRFALAGAGGTLIAAGIGVFAVAVWRTFAASSRRDAIAWSFPLSASWLVATTLAGVTLALNRRAPFLPLSVLDLLDAHAHLGLVGFFVTLLQGATFQLVPMFTMAELRRPRLVTVGLALTQIGLALLVPALAFGLRALALAAAALLVAGIGSSGSALVATARSRRRKKLEPGLHAFFVGAALLGLTALGGIGLLVLRQASSAAILAYGCTAIAGALSCMVLGMLCKIVPFLVWMRTYGPLAGRQPVPLATALGSKRLERTWLGLHVTAVTILVGGIVAAAHPMLIIGTALLLGAVGVFCANLLRIARHLIRAQAPAPVPLRPAVTTP